MLFSLYFCGKGIAQNGRILSRHSAVAIIVYTFNEGLRFGRGIDYNEYWRTYESIGQGFVSDRDFVFVYFFRLLNELNFPYQFFVILASFLFIVGVISLLLNYKIYMPYALPLFALFSMSAVENMIRFFFGFSFVLIGMSFLLRKKKKEFLFFCIVGCLFHMALFPIPILFLIISLIKTPILHPFISIPLYFVIAIFFNTKFMLNFADTTNLLFSFSERYKMYAENSDTWLIGGYGGITRSPFPPISHTLFLVSAIWIGYNRYVKDNSKSIIAYNLFVIGFLLVPIAQQIEIVNRYDHCFLFFRAIICAIILKHFGSLLYVKEKVSVVSLLFLLSISYYCFSFFKAPFLENEKKYMYVWNHDKETYGKMIQMWLNENQKAAKKNK